MTCEMNLMCKISGMALWQFQSSHCLEHYYYIITMPGQKSLTDFYCAHSSQDAFMDVKLTRMPPPTVHSENCAFFLSMSVLSWDSIDKLVCHHILLLLFLNDNKLVVAFCGDRLFYPECCSEVSSPGVRLYTKTICVYCALLRVKQKTKTVSCSVLP